MGEVMHLANESERKKIMALKLFSLCKSDKRKILKSLPAAIVVDLQSLMEEIREMGVLPAVAAEFVWGKEKSSDLVLSGEVGWSGFISVLENCETSETNSPAELIRELKEMTSFELVV